jgi:hypothetical protein
MLLLENGVPPNRVAEQLGDNLETVSKIYLSPESLSRNTLDDIFKIIPERG